MTALFDCNFLVGLPANIYAVWLITSCVGGAIASELFALSLSVSETLSCVLSLYMMLHFLLRLPADVGMQMLQFVLHLMFVSQPVFQSCICLERYLAVVHPTILLR